MTNFKFIQPVSMCVDQEQANYLYSELEKREYASNSYLHTNNELVVYTNPANTPYQYSSSRHIDHEKTEHNRYFIDHYNPELFLALASMTDKVDGNYGEWWYDPFMEEKFPQMGAMISNKDHMKLKKNMLIEHLGMKNQVKEEPKLIGYKLIKPEYESAVAKILKPDVWKLNSEINLRNSGHHIAHLSDSFALLQKAGVLDLWFEKVYEEPKVVEEELFCVKLNKTDFEFFKQIIKNYKTSLEILNRK